MIIDNSNKVFILDIPLHVCTRKSALDVFFKLVKTTKTPVFTATPNAEIILASLENKELKEVLQNSKLNIADAVSLLWADAYLKNKWCLPRALFELLLLPLKYKLWNKNLPERICGSDFFVDICQRAEKERKSVFFLGGEGEVPELLKKKMKEYFPKLKVAGAISGHPDYKKGEKFIKQINESKADILFTAYGCPAQELWLKNNLSKLNTVKISMGVGGSFDFFIGKIKRAPKLFRTLGLEWLWRLIRQPQRIERIMKAVVVFPYRVLQSNG